MQNLFEQYGAKHKSDCSDCRSFKHYGGVCNLDTQPTCPQANHNYSLTSDKVLALEEVIIKALYHLEKTGLSSYYYLTMGTPDNGWFYGIWEQADCEEYEDDWHEQKLFLQSEYRTRTEALSNLLIKLHSYFSDGERNQIQTILKG